jgi:hypothetical protein
MSGECTEETRGAFLAEMIDFMSGSAKMAQAA